MKRAVLQGAVVASFLIGLLLLAHYVAGDRDRQMLATALKCQGMPFTVALDRLGKPSGPLLTREAHDRYRIPYVPGTSVYMYSGGVSLVWIRVDGGGRVIDAFRSASP
jgi:hypothetical protein